MTGFVIHRVQKIGHFDYFSVLKIFCCNFWHIGSMLNGIVVDNIVFDAGSIKKFLADDQLFNTLRQPHLCTVRMSCTPHLQANEV